MWHPQLVGVVQGYPKTQEIWQAKHDLMSQQIRLYNAEGITFRNGVPNGWAGKKKLINAIHAAAMAEAKDIVKKMVETEVFKPDCEEAKLAMETAVEIMTAEKHTPDSAPTPLYSAAERNKALKTILEFTQRRPVSRSEVAAAKAEDWLAALAAKV